MRKAAPIVMLVFALIFSVFILSDESYKRRSIIKESISLQTEKNTELSREVLELKSRVYQLQNNTRELEKTARNKLGMARPDEEIFIFESR